MDRKQVVMKDGSLAGNVVVGFYLLDKMGIDKTKVKQDEWGQLWGSLFQYRTHAPAMKVADLDKIADNKFTPPKGNSRAEAAYQALSNVLDNLYTMYGEES